VKSRAAILLTLVLAVSPPLARASAPDPASAWTSATEAFDRAAALLDDNRPAQHEFAAAADLFGLIADDPRFGERDRARAAFNRGTALLLADQPAPALLSLRRAERVEPWNPDVRAAIAAAHAKLAGSSAPPTPEPPPALRTLRAALALAPEPVVAMFAVAALALAIVTIALRTLRVRVPMWIGGLSIFTALAGAGVITAVRVLDARDAARRAIVLEPNVRPRAGPDALVHAALSDPLPLGAEVRLSSAAPTPESGWIEIQLPGWSGTETPVRTGWVPASALGRVLER
jgi:hypothetical protein